MKIDWLEQYVQDGLVSDQARQQIYQDCSQVVKHASVELNEQQLEMIVNAAKELRNEALFGIGIAGGVGAWQGGKALLERHRIKKEILANREAIAEQHDQYADKARARFDEILSFAPHVAANHALASKMVASKLHEGLSDQDAQNLAMIQAQYVEKLRDNKKFQPKLASVRPEVAGEMAADICAIIKSANMAEKLEKTVAEAVQKSMGRAVKMKGPGRLERMVDEAVSKAVSGQGSKSKTLLDTLGRIGIYTVPPLMLSVGTGLAGHMVGKLENRDLKKKLDESFDRAMRLSDPDSEPLHEDRHKTREIFNTLVHFSPHVALDPRSAHSFLLKSLKYEGQVPTSDIKELSEIHKNLNSQAKPSPFSAGFSAGAKYTGAEGMSSKSIERATTEWLSGKSDERQPRKGG